MNCIQKITSGLTWVGAASRQPVLFEGRYPIPSGVTYNSYLITDEKTALLDTADSSVAGRFLENVSAALAGRPLDYLIVHHMEPDHCGSMRELLARFPDLKIVTSAKALELMKQFFTADLSARAVIVKENDTLCLGARTLRFFAAPMVHWPEVIVSYDETEQILFSADAFGSFGAGDGRLFQNEFDLFGEWLPEARRYYCNIVGKFGPQVQAILKKLSALPLSVICPLHGPVWRGDFDFLLEKYRLWSSYQPEDHAVAIFYGSMYGHTANAAEILAGRLSCAGISVRVYDMSVTHVSSAVSEAFRCSHLVFAAPTYNNGVFPPVRELLHDLQALNLQNRTVAFMENGSWAPMSAKQMRELTDACKNMTVLEPTVTIRSALNADSLAQLEALAQTIRQDMIS